jgi:hypothetical protein
MILPDEKSDRHEGQGGCGETPARCHSREAGPRESGERESIPPKAERFFPPPRRRNPAYNCGGTHDANPAKAGPGPRAF